MPGVFEPCTLAGPSGVVTVPFCLQTPLSRSIGSSLQKLLGDRVRLDLVTFGIIEQQLNQSSNQLGSQAFAQLVMHSPVTGLFRVLLDVSSSHHPSPGPRATYDWAYPIGSPFSICTYGVTDSALKRLASTAPVRRKCRACFFSAPPLDDMRSI